MSVQSQMQYFIFNELSIPLVSMFVIINTYSTRRAHNFLPFHGQIHVSSRPIALVRTRTVMAIGTASVNWIRSSDLPYNLVLASVLTSLVQPALPVIRPLPRNPGFSILIEGLVSAPTYRIPALCPCPAEFTTGIFQVARDQLPHLSDAI